MKKSFKRSIAVILSVLMVIASLPFTAFAAAGEYEPNVVMQYGTIFDSLNYNSMHDQTVSDASNVAAYSAIKGPALDYSNGTLTLSAAKATPTADMVGFGYDDYEYTVGDYFTATVRVDNISQLAAFSMAVSYSNSIEPAGIYDNGGTLSFYGISEVPEGATAVYEAGQPLAFASANAVYPGINGGLVGDISYINTQDHYIMAQASATDGSDAVDVSAGTASADFTDPTTGDFGYTYAGQVPVATFIFKIVTADPIQFSVYDTDNTKLPEYSGGLYIANDADGTAVSQYTTYAASTEATGSALMTMNGENENNGTVTPKYLITFKSHDGTVLSSQEYAEGSQVTIPDLPAKEPDADYHYSVAWNQVPSATADANAEYIAVATPVAHTFDDGVVSGSNKVYTCSSCHYQKFEEIKECTHNWVATGVETVKTPATCQATGLKEVEYKCSLCQETKVETEEIPVADHSYGEYVYNEDATYKSSKVYTDGTATATCSVCGATTTKTIAGTGLLRATGAAVTLGAAVQLNVRFTYARQSAFDETYCKIYYNGVPYDVGSEDTTPYSSTTFQYNFDKICPEYFADQVVLTMYGVKDGIVCKGHSVTYSIKQYATNTLKSADSKLSTLLVEMLYYGEADRAYRNHTTTLPSPIADLTDEQKALHTTNVPTYNKLTNTKYETNTGTNEITWMSATMELEGKVIPKIKFRFANTNSIEDYVFTFNIGGKATPITYAEHPEWFETSTTTASGQVAYFIRCEILDADQFREPIDLKVTRTNGTVVSNTLRYSVESYTFSSAYSGNPMLKALVDQLLRYGRADAVYTGKASSYD